MRIRRLFISPCHNFFGHHGGPAGDHAVLDVPEVECVAGRGVRGDRFFDFRDNYKGQITFFSVETYRALCGELGVSDKGPSVFRRNVLVEGVDLGSLIDREFELCGVRFHGTEECRPCAWMDSAFAPGAERLLRGRGGLRAVILQGGVLRVDSAA